MPVLENQPEIMLYTAADLLQHQDISAWSIGCGLDTDERALNTMHLARERMQTETEALVVWDADALNLFSRHEDLQAAIQAGAQFGVSPGLTPLLAQAVSHETLPFLPGVATASEVMQALDWGFDTFKLFPAAAIGGIPLLKSWAGPLAQARFCPTGGIDANNAASYLALDNVLAVGGSWLMPADKVAQGDWQGISALARQACSLSRHS